MKSGIIVFARLNSMRLPGKALIKIAGIRLIDRVLNRVQKAEGASITVVATTDTNLDDQLVEYLEGRDVYIYRGSGSDVALRAACCAKFHNLDCFVRISGDSPFIDSDLITRALLKYKTGSFDLVTNVFPRTFPRGVSVEVIKTQAIQRLLELTQQEFYTEHVTPYFYDNSDKFSIKNIFSNNVAFREANLAVDTPTDLKRINWILETFGEGLDLSLLAEKSNLWNSKQCD